MLSIFVFTFSIIFITHEQSVWIIDITASPSTLKNKMKVSQPKYGIVHNNNKYKIHITYNYDMKNPTTSF